MLITVNMRGSDPETITFAFSFKRTLLFIVKGAGYLRYMRLTLNKYTEISVSSFGKCLISKWPGLLYREALKAYQSAACEPIDLRRYICNELSV